MRYYSSTAGDMELSVGINASDISITVNTVVGLPGTTPFSLVVDVGSASEEILEVTNVSGLTLTVTRGVDGSSAQAHSAGAVVRHMATARDFREPQEHIAAAAGVHGVTGSVVGTTDTQALTHKNLTDATNTFPASLATTSALSAHEADTSAHGVAGTIVGTTDAQTLSGKTMSGSVNTFSNIPQSAVTSLTTDQTTQNSRLTALESDTGWVTLSTSGFTGTVVNPVAYRKIGNVVYMRGNVSSFTSGSFETLCTLPAGARPSITTNIGVSSNTAATMVISIDTAGVVTVWCSATTSAWLGLANVVFPV